MDELSLLIARTTAARRSRTSKTRPLHLASPSPGRGFGKKRDDEDLPSSLIPPDKTYGARSTGSRPIRDLIDSEAAMREFFTSREEWLPLFRQLSNPSSQSSSSYDPPPAQEWLSVSETAVGDTENDARAFGPWKDLPAIPTDESDRTILAGFLDSMHQSLLDIPVTDSEEDDDLDLHFVEEGRRMLALSRFQVVRTNSIGRESGLGRREGSLEAYDDLFATCWSEVKILAQQGEQHTGSLIVLPDYDLADLRRFADLNLHRPLEWLGLHHDFEIVSMQRQSPAIRLLYKLQGIPETTPPAPPPTTSIE